MDQNKTEGKANEFLAKRHYDWPNYHESPELEQLLGSQPIPRTMLVNASGMIVYDHLGFSLDEIRQEIAKMAPHTEDPAKEKNCRASQIKASSNDENK